MIDLTRAYGLDFLFPARDRFVGASLRDAGEFARPEMEIIGQLLRRAKGTYLDVGANIGSIALPVAAATRDCRVVAIEGNRQLAAILAANALGNRLLNVDVHHAVAGASEGLMAFPAPPLDSAINFGALHVAGADQPDLPVEQTRMCTLDSIAPADTSVVKIDVEGFEWEVLDGATDLIAARRAAWVIEHKGDDLAHRVTDRFLRAGYRLFWLFAPFVTMRPLKPFKPNEGGIRGDTNLLALPEGDPPVEMTPIIAADEARPGGLDGFPYLKRYGF